MSWQSWTTQYPAASISPRVKIPPAPELLVKKKQCWWRLTAPAESRDADSQAFGLVFAQRMEECVHIRPDFGFAGAEREVDESGCKAQHGRYLFDCVAFKIHYLHRLMSVDRERAT